MLRCNVSKTFPWSQGRWLLPRAKSAQAFRDSGSRRPILRSCGHTGMPGYGVKIFGEKLTFSNLSAMSLMTRSVSRRCRSSSPGNPKIRLNVTRIPARPHFRAASYMSGMC